MCGCTAKFAKFVLIVFNLFFWLSGCALAGVGLWIRLDPRVERYIDVLQEIDDQNFIYWVSYLMIAAGGVIILVGFLGCCGAIRESRCMLGVYVAFLLLILLAEIAGGVLSIIYKEKIQEKIKDDWAMVLKGVYKVPEEGKEPNAFTLGMDFIQVEFECCGVLDNNSIIEYAYSSYSNSSGYLVPPTCCKLEDPAKVDGYDKVEEFVTDDDGYRSEDFVDLEECQRTAHDDYINTDGCYEEMKDWIESRSLLFIILCIAIAATQILGIIFACCVCRGVKDDFA